MRWSNDVWMRRVSMHIGGTVLVNRPLLHYMGCSNFLSLNILVCRSYMYRSAVLADSGGLDQLLGKEMHFSSGVSN